MTILNEILSIFLSEKCYGLLLNQTFSLTCFKILLSKTIGWSIVILSSLVKLPQIIKIKSSLSGDGISMGSIILELFATSIHTGYCCISKYPFSAWGDAFFLSLQSILILYLCLLYRTGNNTALPLTSAAVLLILTLISGFIPYKLLVAFESCVIPLSLISKILQVWTNYKNNNTGQCSAIMWFLMFFGSIARIFTSVVETGDFLIILTFILSAVVNAVVSAQIIYYRSTTKRWFEMNKLVIKKLK